MPSQWHGYNFNFTLRICSSCTASSRLVLNSSSCSKMFPPLSVWQCELERFSSCSNTSSPNWKRRSKSQTKLRLKQYHSCKMYFNLIFHQVNKPADGCYLLCLALSKLVTYSGVGGKCLRLCANIHRVVSGQPKVPLGLFCLIIRWGGSGAHFVGKVNRIDGLISSNISAFPLMSL